MSNSILTEISCPNCLAPINLTGHGTSVSCDSCHSRYVLEGHLCSHCSAYYKDEVAVCGRCGTAMTRSCRKCHTDNWAGDEYCKSCGVVMDLLDMATISHKEQTAKHQAIRKSQIRDIRAKGEASSEKRMTDMRQAERDRVAQIAERKRKRRLREFGLFVLMGLMVTVAAALIAVFFFS